MIMIDEDSDDDADDANGDQKDWEGVRWRNCFP